MEILNSMLYLLGIIIVISMILFFNIKKMYDKNGSNIFKKIKINENKNNITILKQGSIFKIRHLVQLFKNIRIKKRHILLLIPTIMALLSFFSGKDDLMYISLVFLLCISVILSIYVIKAVINFSFEIVKQVMQHSNKSFIVIEEATIVLNKKEKTISVEDKKYTLEDIKDFSINSWVKYNNDNFRHVELTIIFYDNFELEIYNGSKEKEVNKLLNFLDE
jgi:hypothetical protein